MVQWCIAAASMLRPAYWLKNLLVFVPAYLAGTLLQQATALHCVIAFLVTCALASGCYILNDVADLPQDARHPQKQRRALASGRVTRAQAMVLAFLLIAPAILCAWLFIPATVVPLLAYGTGSLSYSFVLKRWMALDVVWLAALHALRLIIGGAAADVILSHWLLTFAALFFLSLAAAKRVSELFQHNGSKTISFRPYGHDHGKLLRIFGMASGLGSVIVLSLYARHFTMSPDFYSHPMLLWAVVACVAGGLWHFWRSAIAGNISGDPVGFALTDRKSICIALIMFAFMTLARM